MQEKIFIRHCRHSFTDESWSKLCKEKEDKALQAFLNWWIMVGVVQKKMSTRHCRHSFTDESWSELCRRKWTQGTAGIPPLMNRGRSCAENDHHKALQAFLHCWIMVGVLQRRCSVLSKIIFCHFPPGPSTNRQARVSANAHKTIDTQKGFRVCFFCNCAVPLKKD